MLPHARKLLLQDPLVVIRRLNLLLDLRQILAVLAQPEVDEPLLDHRLSLNLLVSLALIARFQAFSDINVL